MPITQTGESASFHVQGDYYDYGTQIITHIASSGMITHYPYRSLTTSHACVYPFTATVSQTKYVYVPPRPLSPRFTGQEVYLEKLRTHFAPLAQSTHQRKTFLLHGKGGVGKTQLVLKYAEENADRYEDPHFQKR